VTPQLTDVWKIKKDFKVFSWIFFKWNNI